MLNQCVPFCSYSPPFLSVFQRRVWFPAARRQVPWDSPEPGGGRASWGSAFPTQVPSRSPGPWETGLTAEKQKGEEEMFLVDMRGSGLPTFLPEMGDPLPSRSPCSSANAQAEIPWLVTWQCLRSGRLLGHLVTNLTWVRGATACWGFCGPLCDHLLSCLYTQPGLVLICWVQIPTVNKAPLHSRHFHDTRHFLPILSSSTPKKQKCVCCAL